MMRSLFSAVSGLKTHQQRMDVIGNNIANVNTPGFKRSRVTFQDMLNQTIRGASRPVDGGRGGTNPIQIGPGVTIASIDTIFGGSSLQDTGKATDLGIDGDGFFILSDGKGKAYTRVGSFDFDDYGNLVSLVNGMRVQGWMAENGEIKTGDPGNIQIPSQGITANAKATEKMVFAGNLDARANGILSFNDGTGASKFTVSDTSVPPNSAEFQLTFTPTNSFNTWEWSITAVDATVGSVVSGGTGTVTLDLNGNISGVTGGDTDVLISGNTVTISSPVSGDKPEVFTVDPLDGSLAGINETNFTPAETRTIRQTVYDSLGTVYKVITTMERLSDQDWSYKSEVIKETETGAEIAIPLDPGAGEGTITFNNEGKFLTFTGTNISFDPGNGAAQLNIQTDFQALTQYASKFSATVQNQDGYQDGKLDSYSFDNTGTIVGVFSNGVTQTLAQVALANFSNPAGLMKRGDSLYSESSNSGQAIMGASGEEGFGMIKPGSLEMSNVDLSSEFTDMIITQRGFQANSRVITASDEMLQELVNLKR